MMRNRFDRQLTELKSGHDSDGAYDWPGNRHGNQRTE